MQKKRSILKSQTIVQRKKRLRRVLFGLAVFLCSGCVVGIIFLSRYSKILISEIKVEGAVVVSPDDLKKNVEEKISGQYLYVFPRRNALLYPKNLILKSILADFPRVESVKVARSGWQTLIVSIEERKPSALWCAGDRASQPSSCFFFDSTGFIFDHAPDFSGSTYLRYYGGITGTPIGQIFTPKLPFPDIKNILTFLSSQNLPIAHVVTRDYDYDLETSDGRRILINPEQSVPKTLDNLSVILKQRKNATTSWQYIDLRFGNKIYVNE